MHFRAALSALHWHLCQIALERAVGALARRTT
jgi:hypothetical protein